MIRFEDGLFSDFASVLAAASQVGSAVYIQLDAQNTLTLANVQRSSLHQDDFLLTA